MILSFDVENQTLKRKDENKIVEKSKNYVHAIFFFSEEWDDTQKAAIIENGGMRFKVYLENNECDIPNRAVSHDGFTITIVGEDDDKNITITTTDLFIAVQKNNASDIQEEYIKNITSDTLDLTREGENCNIEIPSKYRKTFLHKLTITMGFYRYDEETEGEIEVECGTIEAYAVVDTEAKITIDNFENYNKFIVIPTQLVELRTDDDVFEDTIYSGIINSDNEIQFIFINARRFEYFSTEDMGIFIMNISDSF